MQEQRFIIKQNGQRVVTCYGRWPHIMGEAAHYLAVYGQDGPCEIEWQERRDGRWRRAR